MDKEIKVVVYNGTAQTVTLVLNWYYTENLNELVKNLNQII